MSHEVPDVNPESQVNHGKLQMLGAVGLYEVGMNLSNTIWGAAAILSSGILAVYGLKDYLVGRHQQEP